MSAFVDIGQGAGLATSSGIRPLLPPIVAGVLAKADAGTDFSGTDWSWMESWVWIGILVALFIAGWVFDRSRTNDAEAAPQAEKRERPEASIGYGMLAAAMGALTFAASLAAGGHASWPGIVAGAILGFIGFLAFARLFMRATERLQVAGDSGTLLGLGRDALGIAISVSVVFVGVIGYAVVAAALLLLAGTRRREGEKYQGLRVLR
jgi:cytochrome b561